MRKQYDAFGRPIEPGATGSGGRPTAAPRVAGRPDPTSGGRTPGASQGGRAPGRGGAGPVVPRVRGLPTVDGDRPDRPRRTGLRRAAGSIAAVVLLVSAVAGGLVDDEDRGRGTGSSSAGGTSDAPSLTADRADRSIGLLRGAMRPGDRVVSVSLSASYALARVRGGDGTTRSLSVSDDGDVRSSPSASSSSSSEGVPATDLDTAAPRTIVAAVRRGLGPGTTGTLTSLSAYSYRDEPLRWTVGVRGGAEVDRSWSADASGRAVVRTRDGAPAPPPGDPGPATTPRGIAGRSLLVAANLRSALGAVGSLPGLRDRTPRQIRIGSLNVEPERILVGVDEGAVGRRLVAVDAAFGADPSAVTGSAGETPIPLPDVDPAGPSRALRTIGRRLSDDAASRVVSVSLATVRTAAGDERPGWFVLLEGGSSGDRIWRATLDGRRVGRSGEDLTR